MTTQEFKDFCHEQFTKYGFSKRTKRDKQYFLNGTTGVLAGISLQRSNYGSAYYVNVNFYIGEFDDPKLYPSEYEGDISIRITVLSKDTIKGECFMTGFIDHPKYTVKELQPYFEDALNQIIIPPLLVDKNYLVPFCIRGHVNHWKTPEEILSKLNA